VQIALLENKRLVELHHEQRDNQFAVGDIYLGIVKRVLPALNAVFVDIGYDKDAFLHYYDLGPQIRTQNKFLKAITSSRNNIVPIDAINPLPDINKNGKMSEVLKGGQTVLVQIMKEPIASKGPRLASQLSIAGQYMILLPFGRDISISRKIRTGEEKNRLRQALEPLKRQNMGFIVRTAAEGVEADKLRAEYESLYHRWEMLVEEVAEARPTKRVLSEMGRVSTLLRDMLSVGFEAIHTDDRAVHQEIEAYLRENQPDFLPKLQFKKSKTGLFETFGIERQIKGAFGRTVNMANGSYLIIDHTEALHVIDVNSGSQRFDNASPEDNALRINLMAAAEIARQLRLRDMGGIIVIDFIDQKNPENKRVVFQRLVDEMKKDRARHTILPMSRFGLIQLTRQRVRPEVNIVTDEVCPSCNGTGKIQPSILVTDELEKNVALLVEKTKVKRLSLEMHPFLAAYYMQGFPSRRFRWWLKYKKWIRIAAKSSQAITAVRYFDEAGEEIKLD